MRNLLVFILLSLCGGVCKGILKSYVAEVYFVIDNKVVENYMKERTESTSYARKQKAVESVKADVNYFVAEINQMYKTMASNGLSIELRSRKLEILNKDLFYGAVAEADVALPKFDQWLADENAYNSLGYDIAILWTGHELVHEGADKTVGYAHVGGVCARQRSTAIVEFDGTYHTVVVTAHEIGHIFGAEHDIVDVGYVMSADSSADSRNRWAFSSYSATTILSNIAQTTCLLQTNPASVALSGPVTSDLSNPDIICQRAMKSRDSYLCKSPSFYDNSVPKGDHVCRDIYCKEPGDSTYCISAFSSDGLTCGVNKVCRDGTCQYDATSGTANIDADCIWGDVKVFTIDINGDPFKGSCSTFLSTYGSNMCSNSVVSQPCCGTCAKLRNTAGPADCPYGDQKILKVTVNDVPFSGACPLFISRYGNDMCDYDSIKEACCSTCRNTGRRSRGGDGDPVGSSASNVQRSDRDKIQIHRNVLQEVAFHKKELASRKEEEMNRSLNMGR